MDTLATKKQNEKEESSPSEEVTQKTEPSHGNSKKNILLAIIGGLILFVLAAIIITKTGMSTAPNTSQKTQIAQTEVTPTTSKTDSGAFKKSFMKACKSPGLQTWCSCVYDSGIAPFHDKSDQLYISSEGVMKARGACITKLPKIQNTTVKQLNTNPDMYKMDVVSFTCVISKYAGTNNSTSWYTCDDPNSKSNIIISVYAEYGTINTNIGDSLKIIGINRGRGEGVYKGTAWVSILYVDNLTKNWSNYTKPDNK